MEKTLTFTAGAIVRGALRRAAFMLGLEIEEDKGWLTSAFRVSGPAEKVDRFVEWVRENDLAEDE